MVGKLYDDFRICDKISGDVLFTVIPKSGFEKDFGMSELWGKEGEDNFRCLVKSESFKTILSYFAGGIEAQEEEVNE